MEFKSTSLHGVYQIFPKIFRDFRGDYTEIFHQEEFETWMNLSSMVLPPEQKFTCPKFVTDCVSYSHQHVLRGFHGSFDGNWKLTQCVYGEVYSVIVNNDMNSDQYLKWEAFNLNDKERNMLLIPPGFGNSFMSMTPFAVYKYKQSQYYKGPEQQFTLRWDDPRINAYWPIKHPILSKRDAEAPYLR